ncbi:hypothetical protein [Bacillus atrophaeus]|uniref:hypothetical protein n=1 Tax=Bacillus atrophaeus TaxID=1452 RepID=UPI002E2098CB|nr:hypothetical protein [Bacillus atrophaeus]MED1031429.1 hypothetical protein [Bacillus atrophaeus]MED1120261.1 hypothetical protein [Bacillus atrophaeus]MED1124617.1 hypothetical protein [Bacillus atrophaeus]MED1130007.1 hypothetical protein [Bacillus atrophaeus]
MGTSSAIGFGTSVPGITIIGGTIDLTGLLSEAFTVPRAGTITSIAGHIFFIPNKMGFKRKQLGI